MHANNYDKERLKRRTEGENCRGRRKEFFKGGVRGVVLNGILQKCSDCSNLFPNTLYKGNVQNLPKKL